MLSTKHGVILSDHAWRSTACVYMRERDWWGWGELKRTKKEIPVGVAEVNGNEERDV